MHGFTLFVVWASYIAYANLGIMYQRFLIKICIQINQIWTLRHQIAMNLDPLSASAKHLYETWSWNKQSLLVSL